MSGSLGMVYFVGAGPGAPGLITVTGVRCLERADVVIYDHLTNARLLEYAPVEAERLLVEIHDGEGRAGRSVVTELLIDRARHGLTVIRLLGGDPFVFGSGGEEAKALAAADIRFEIVPGVASAVAVPAYAGIPLIHRDMASSFTVLTGYEDADIPEEAARWDAVARPGGTLVLLVASRELRANMDKLIAHGMAPDTPVAVIRWGTVAEQETITGTAAGIADIAEATHLQLPAVAVVGEVVRLRERLAWFEEKPLFGRRILVTRPREQAAAFVERLAAAGADVLNCPTIEIVPPESWQPLDDAIRRIERYDWLVFTSVNGVTKFFERLRELGRDVRVLHRARLAAVGPQTADALVRRGLLVDVVPDEFRAEGVAQAMRVAGISAARVLLPRAARAREILPVLLREAGAQVDEVTSYEAVPARTDLSELRARLAAGTVDLVTFTSSSTVRNFLALLGDDSVASLKHTRIGCIGPVTAETARAAGLQVTIQPAAYTISAFTKAILAYFAAAPRRSTRQ